MLYPLSYGRLFIISTCFTSGFVDRPFCCLRPLLHPVFLVHSKAAGPL